jgi:hypothetical protein
MLVNTVVTRQIDARISNLESAMNHRFDEVRELWLMGFHRVEEALDARLKHIEEERG